GGAEEKGIGRSTGFDGLLNCFFGEQAVRAAQTTKAESPSRYASLGTWYYREEESRVTIRIVLTNMGSGHSAKSGESVAGSEQVQGITAQPARTSGGHRCV
ncbi:hypothetical protein CSUI_007913, partial [Cystoisospora suis]